MDGVWEGHYAEYKHSYGREQVVLAKGTVLRHASHPGTPRMEQEWREGHNSGPWRTRNLVQGDAVPFAGHVHDPLVIDPRPVALQKEPSQDKHESDANQDVHGNHCPVKPSQLQIAPRIFATRIQIIE